MEHYIRTSAIQTKLKQSKYRIIYLHSVAGYGKTSAVTYFLRNSRYVYYKGEDLTEGELGARDDLEDQMLVIDNIQWIKADPIHEEIRELCRKKGKEIILIGRGNLPEWLSDLTLELGILICNESDLLLGEKEILNLAEKMGLELSKPNLQMILQHTGGHAAGVCIILLNLESGEEFCNEQVQVRIWKGFFGYLDRVCFEMWDEDLREILLPLGNLESFTIDMVEYLTGRSDVGRIIKYANSVGGFLKQNWNNEWEILTQFQMFLKWKCAQIYSSEDYERLYKDIASYYEKKDKLQSALKYYELAQNRKKMIQLLIKNALKQPSMEGFYECRKYYFKLEREEILQSSVLIAGMSMLYSILLMPEESEEWYQELEAYAERNYLSERERKDARIHLAYLNIVLPHRGTKEIFQIIKDTYIMMTQKKEQLPEFSVTDNVPSIMFGDKDFSEWSQIDQELLTVLKKPIEVILGKSSRGILNVMLAESGYEKGNMSDYELQTRLNTGFLMADSGGRIETCFAAIGVMIQLHMMRGQVDVAKNLLCSFKEKAKKEQSAPILKNIDACLAWIAMMTGDRDTTEQWLIATPDENQEFCVLERFIYLQKVRMYITFSRYAQATGLIEKLYLYCTSYQRYHDCIKILLLKSILLYRLGIEQWKESLEDALLRAEKYHFVRMVAVEGVALLPLLLELKSNKIDAKFFGEVRDETQRIARMYPEYMKMEEKRPEVLTEREKEILKLLCQGMSAKEICDRCNITYNSLKFHNRNIYKKLGVRNRYEAERKALLMEL